MKIDKEKFNNTMTQLMVFVVGVVIIATFQYFKKDRWAYYDYPTFSVEFPVSPEVREKDFVVDGYNVPAKRIICSHLGRLYSVYTLEFSNEMLHSKSQEKLFEYGISIVSDSIGYKLKSTKYEPYNGYQAYTALFEYKYPLEVHKKTYASSWLIIVDNIMHILHVDYPKMASVVGYSGINNIRLDKKYKRFVDSFQIDN